MPELPVVDNYAALLLGGQPLLDVRAPCEFSKGAFPGAVNLPLLDDEERHKIGLCYKQHGQQAAIELGQKLVSGAQREQRIDAWCRFARQYPHGYLYCFRGGLRSRIAQDWMAQAGVRYPRIKGGYKFLRRFLIDTVEQWAAQRSFVILAGKTGTAKTRLLRRLDNSVDLEALANHRGSAFGRKLAGQPGQIDFENALSIALLRKQALPGHLFLEDESRTIGSVSVPLPLFEKMKVSPVVLIEEALEDRVEVILHDYIQSNYRDYCAAYQHDAQTRDAQFAAYLTGSLLRIQRRLGGRLAAEILADMQQALGVQAAGGDADGHRVWIRKLLLQYYDPMYDYQLNKKQHRVIFRGSKQDFLNCSIALQDALP